MKILKRMHNQQEARIIVSYLQSNGVDAQLLDGEMHTILPVAGGVRIAVPDEQLDLAETLISRANAGDAQLPEGTDHES